MNIEDRGILVGMVLGDAYLNVRHRLNNGRNPWISSELSMAHCIKQHDYLLYKFELIKKIFGGEQQVHYYEHHLPQTGKSYKMCRFSKSNIYFKTLHGMMYKDGKKFISKHVLEMLTPHGIAIWYMDDGHGRINKDKNGWISSCASEIATFCSEEEAINIQEYFAKEYGVEFKIRFDKRRSNGHNYYIQANTHASQDFIGIIKPYIIPSMMYKLAHVAGLSFHECQTPTGQCLHCGCAIYDNRRKNLCSKCYHKQLQPKLPKTA